MKSMLEVLQAQHDAFYQAHQKHPEVILRLKPNSTVRLSSNVVHLIGCCSDGIRVKQRLGATVSEDLIARDQLTQVSFI
jgi:hypothetical protein